MIKRKRECRPVVVDGETVRVLGDYEMDEISRKHFAEIVLAVKRRYESESVVWETCSVCGRDYAYPHLCRKHLICGLCHE